MPFFVSSTGYGLLWDNYASSYLNPPAAESQLPFHTVTLNTGQHFNGSASFTANVTGEHNFYVELEQPPSFGAGFGITLKMVTSDGQTVLDWEALTNLPNGITGRGIFEASLAHPIPRRKLDLPF